MTKLSNRTSFSFGCGLFYPYLYVKNPYLDHIAYPLNESQYEINWLGEKSNCEA